MQLSAFASHRPSLYAAIICLVVTWPAYPVSGQSAQAVQDGQTLRNQAAQGRGAEASDLFVKDSISRLSNRIPPEQFRQIENKASVWRATRSNADFLVLTDEIYTAALKVNIKSDVTISSSKGKGATVKYQTLGQRQRNEPPTNAKQLTEAVESMVLGMYYIWSERGGAATSDRNAQFDIAAAKEKVALEEK
jgi:hypothetical protein